MSEVSSRQALARGWRGLCPACGRSRLFESRGRIADRCAECGVAWRSREPDTWFFMYASTAAITGLFLILMLLVTPARPLLWRGAIALAAVATFGLTHSRRKGLALALEYLLDRKLEHPRH